MEHIDIPAGEIHVPYNWVYADAAARTGSTHTSSLEIGLCAYQSDNKSLWMLVGHTPGVWHSIGAISVNGVAMTSTTGDVAIVKGDLSLGNVENKSSSTIRGEITSGNVTAALGYTPVNPSVIGAASGVCPLDSGSKISSTYLPAYVDDILEYANLAAFPGTGTTGLIYVAIDTNRTYRWSGSAYVMIVASPGTTSDITEGSKLFFTEARVLASVLAGLSTSTGTAVTSSDSVLVAAGKLQKQITDALVFAKAYDTSGMVAGKPTASQVILRVKAARAFSLASSLTGSTGVAGTAATASTVFDVKKNGSSIGSMTFAISGTSASFSGAGGSFAIGDLLTVVAPASPDTTCADVAFTLLGTLT